MKVVFLEEVEGTARTGDVKNVANGFARNYLLPRKLAAPATPHFITIASAKATKEARKQARLDEDAQKLVPLVEGKEITIEVRVGEQEKLFGSVTGRDIAELLAAETKLGLEHRQIDLKQPLRELGPHNVGVKLTRNVVANIIVHVEPVGGRQEPEAPAEEPVVEGVTEMGEPSAADTSSAPVDEEPSPAELVEGEGADESGVEEVATEDPDAAELTEVEEDTERTSEEG